MRVFLLAGEPSGDRLGGALMAGLRELVPDVEFDGIGGQMMQAQGLVSRFPMDELSVMGLVEVLPKYFHLKRRIAETAQAVLDTRPDVLITIDSPDFSLRVAGLVKAASDIRTVHYVAPSVWAWRPGRADRMARVIDHVLALLPFEPPYMERAGMACDFVGHPVVAEPQATPAEIVALREALDLGDAPVLLVLPGSRRGEVDRLAPVFGAGLKRFLAEAPEMRVVVPAVGHVADAVRLQVADWPGDPVVLDPRHVDPDTAAAHKRAAFATAELALAASGTVSLELAAAGTPMVIAYKVSWLTQKIAERMVSIDTVTLVNLVSETRVVPECLGPGCTPEAIARHLAEVRADPQAQQAAMEATMDRLGRGGEAPGLRAARAVLSGMRA
ncbi:lipid-A-disaccharide synthase [Cribrihabitans marinus]|uniref:Lipid-A-disaccharide synthase n=1 Tax=Cribrihabitans marinus TaxID=1227549 RepID=A0A1H6QX26_9RHOB|nr:lipid-A-disaccharide synthase [Cribrihabitans marinus]GGH19017.1 lipid-A-disaccharide synthase [Cribrihabitans marinus]SEI43522.1 lipid-A-disaccharide synthase [Cribrihabitans marinus]